MENGKRKYMMNTNFRKDKSNGDLRNRFILKSLIVSF